MLDQTALNMALDLAVGAHGIPQGKVVCPSFQMPIELSDQDRDRLKALMTIRHFVQLLPLSLDRLLRRKHIQILSTSTFPVAIVPKCVPQKVQTRAFLPVGSASPRRLLYLLSRTTPTISYRLLSLPYPKRRPSGFWFGKNLRAKRSSTTTTSASGRMSRRSIALPAIRGMRNVSNNPSPAPLTFTLFASVYGRPGMFTRDLRPPPCSTRT